MNLKIKINDNLYSLDKVGISYLIGENILSSFIPNSNNKLYISYDEEDISSLSKEKTEDYLNKVYFLADKSLISSLNVKDNLLLLLDVQKIKKDEKQNIISSTCEITGVNNLLKKKLNNLSKEELFKVKLTAALVKDAEVIFINEEILSEEIYSLIKKISLDKTIIIATNDESKIDPDADCIIKVNDNTVTQRNENKNVIPSTRKIYNLGFIFKLKIALKNLFSTKKALFSLILVIITAIFFNINDSSYRYNIEGVKADYLIKNYDYVTLKPYHGFDDNDLRNLQKETDINFTPVIGDNYGIITLPFYNLSMNLLSRDPGLYRYGVYSSAIAIDSLSYLPSNYKLLAGQFPSEENEIMINDYQFYLLDTFGYKYDTLEETETSDRLIISAEEINSPEQVIGLKLYSRIQVPNHPPSIAFDVVISGVIDTGFDFDRYTPLLDFLIQNGQDNTDLPENLRKLEQELDTWSNITSYQTVNFISQKQAQKYQELNIKWYGYTYNLYITNDMDREDVRKLAKLEQNDTYDIQNLLYKQFPQFGDSYYLTYSISFFILLLISTFILCFVTFESKIKTGKLDSDYLRLLGLKSKTQVEISLLEIGIFILSAFIISLIISYPLTILINSAITSYYAINVAVSLLSYQQVLLSLLIIIGLVLISSAPYIYYQKIFSDSKQSLI